MLFRVALVLVTAWKLFAALRFDLCYDEAYYFTWSLSPQACYLDQPPLTAWAMALARSLLGETVLSVRLWPLLGGVALALGGRAMARRMFDERTGDRAGLLLLLAPILVGNGLLMTPDTLLFPCWAAALYASWRALEDRRSISPWWAAAGLAAGAGLLSKYTMVLFVLGLALYAAVTPGRRRTVLAGGAVAAGVALLCFSPVVLWNARHDWASFRYQLWHGLESTRGSSVVNLLLYAAGLLGVATPLLGGACFLGASRGLSEPPRRFLAAFFWAVALFFGATSLKNPVEANWPAAALVPGLVLVAADWPACPRGWRRAIAGMLVTADLAAMAFFSLPKERGLSVLGLSLDLPRMAELSGAEGDADALRRAFAASRTDFLCVDGYQLFGRFAFYAPELRDRLVLEPDGRQRFPWLDQERWRGKSALFVTDRGRLRTAIAPFEAIRVLGSESVPFHGALRRDLLFFLAEGYLPRDLSPRGSP